MIWIPPSNQDHPTTHVVVDAVSTHKTLQESDVHNTTEDVKTQYHVTLYWWLYSSASAKEGFYNL